MASGSRASLILLGLVMASFCVNAASAGSPAGPAQTNKLAFPDSTKTVAALLESGEPIKLTLCLNLSKVLKGLKLQLQVLDAVDGTAVVDLVGGLVQTLDPIVVHLPVDGTLNLVLVVEGIKKNVALPLDLLNPVLVGGAVDNVVGVVIVLVPAVVNSVDVLQILNAVGKLLAVVVGLL